MVIRERDSSHRMTTFEKITAIVENRKKKIALYDTFVELVKERRKGRGAFGLALSKSKV